MTCRTPRPTLLALAALLALPGPAALAKPPKKATKSVCPAGTAPVVSKKGKKLVAKRDRRGRLVCKAIKVKGRPPAPSTTQLGQAADVADALRDAAGINPKAMARLERAIGKRRAAKLLDVALEGWRQSANAAAAGPRARAADETTWKGNDGVTGKASFDLHQADGAQSGFDATVTAELSATRDGVAKLSSTALEKLPPNVTSAKASLEVKFSDLAQTCQSDGKQPGKVKASGKIKVTAERSDGPPVELELAAEIETSYTAKTDADGKWTGIDGVEAKTEFRSSATGESTKVYRGRRLATGMTTDSILDSGNIGTAMERDIGTFDAEHGGVFGPQGSWNFERGISLSDVRSIDNFKAMYGTSIATNLLTLAAVEYLRKVTRDRAEKGACNYQVQFVLDGQGIFATHTSSGHLDALLTLKRNGTTWSGGAPLVWQNLTFTSKTPKCSMIDPISSGNFTVQAELLPSGNLKVTWSSDAKATASIDCEPDGVGDPDPPPIPGMPGPQVIGVEPGAFEVPATGGSTGLSGGVSDGGDGFFNTGSISITRVR